MLLAVAGCNLPEGQRLSTLEASAPMVVYGPAADPEAAAACIQRRLPAGYRFTTRVSLIGDDATVTAYQPLPAISLAAQEAWRWQVQLSRTETALRSNVSGWGEPWADGPVYDAIAACGLSASTARSR